MRGELMATRNEVSSGTVIRTFKTRTPPEVAQRCHCVVQRRDTAHGQLHDRPSSNIAKNHRCASIGESVIRRGLIS
jgi:hypothetical protein